MFFAAVLLVTFSGWGQDLGYDKVWISPNTHLVVAGNTHMVLVDMDFRNDGIFDPGQGTVHFTGEEADSLLGNSGTAFYNLVIDKSVGINHWQLPPELPLPPWPPCSIENQLLFAGAGNKIILSGRDIVFGPTAAVVGADEQNFIATSGNGRVIKESLSNFLFPLGSDEYRYTPLRVTQSGLGSVGVRCLPHVLALGSTGNPLINGVVDVSWEVTQTQPGVSPINLTAQWNASDELPGFDGTDCGIARSLEIGDWDLAGNDIGQKLGQDPFQIIRSDIEFQQNDTIIVFAVGSEPLMYPLRVGMKTYLQGAFNIGTGMMNDDLRSQDLVPLVEPYSQLSGFTHTGRGGGETVSPNVLGISGPGAIVDWVFLELRDAANSATVLETRSALIRRDGMIVDVDGTTPVIFRGMESGSYYFDVRHRNHLGIRTPDAFTLYNDPVLIYDFSTEQASAYQGVQAFLGSNTWGMFGGDANSNSNVRYSGPGNDQNTLLNSCLSGDKSAILSKVYQTCDLNLNGTVRYSGPLNDQNFLLNTVLGGDKAKVLVQPNF